MNMTTFFGDHADQLAIFRPNFVQNCEFHFFVQNAKFRDFVRFSSKTNLLCPYRWGLTRRRRADGPDDGSAQTPRRQAGRRNRDEAMDALLVVEKYLTTGLHACIILFITKDTPY